MSVSTSCDLAPRHADVLAGALVFDVTIQAGKLIFHQLDVLCVGTDANANARSRIPCFAQLISEDDNILRFALQVDGDAILAIATVDDLVVFQVIAVGPEIFSPGVITKQDTDFATAFDTVVLHVVVGVIVANGDPVIA